MRARGRALAAGVMGDDARIDEESLFVRAVADLDEMHIRLLKRLADGRRRQREHGLRLARCAVEDGWPPRRASERFQVSHTTAARWAARYRELGEAGMADRSSRPRVSPARTPVRAERRIVKLRVSKRLGPARIAFRLGLNPSTVHAVLARYGCPPLAHLDRASGQRVRRWEREQPGELVHADIKKLGNIRRREGAR